MKRIILSSIVGGALALATLGGVTQAAPAALGAAALVERPGPGGGRHDRGGQLGIPASLVKATVDQTGLTGKQVADELKAGKSLTQIAQAKGKTADQVIAAARTAIKARLDQAVTNGRLTQAAADQALATFDQQAPTVMADTTLGQKIDQRQDRAKQGAALAILVRATSEVTGLTVQEVRTELKAGKSLSQIAQSKGKTAADVIAKAKELLTARQQEVIDAAEDLVNQAGGATP